MEHTLRLHLCLLAAVLCTHLPARLDAQARSASTTDVSDLPLIEVPARPGTSTTLVVFLSGDGGWAGIDRQIAEVLSERGVGVVGLNSRDYLVRRKSPDETATDVQRIIHAYMARWGATRIVLAGYSRGASMVPFVATRLTPELRSRTVLLAMLGLAPTANFQFHWLDVVRNSARPDDILVAPELERLRGRRMMCVYGSQEAASACRNADPALIDKIVRVGDHHFGGNYRELGELILSMIPSNTP